MARSRYKGLDTFIHILTSGLLIGVFVSAPMGPIGMLVIQRTLNKGRMAAFFTGIGAALSDLTYSLLTGLGMSFVTDFITDNELLLQIVGSVVLCAFANPLILFFIIGLFARFNFFLPEFRYYHYILGYASIFGGALAWWWLITFVIDKVRGHFNVRSMWLLNRIIAVILLVMAAVGLYKGVRGYMQLDINPQTVNTQTDEPTTEPDSAVKPLA